MKRKFISTILSVCMIFTTFVGLGKVNVSADRVSDGQLEKDSGLIAYYPLSRDVKDSSGNGYDAEIHGTGESFADGCLTLPGGKDGSGAAYVQFPTGMLDNKNTLTISMWVKNETGKGNYSTLFLGNTSSPPTRYWLFDSCNPDGYFKTVLTNGAENTSKPWETEVGISSGTATDDKWELYTTVITPAQIIGYYNDKKIGFAKHTTQISDFGENLIAFIGRSPYPDMFFKGSVKNLRIYGRALSDDEIANLVYDGVPDQKVTDKVAESLNLGDLSAVDKNLDLPTRGAGGTVMSWSSSNKSVIDDTGKVTRPKGKQDAQVTLTVTVTKGSAKTKREFSVTVLATEIAEKSDYTLDVNTDKFDHDVSPMLNGLFIEDINRAGNGGLYAELLDNTSFEYTDKSMNSSPLYDWTLINRGGGAGTDKVSVSSPLNINNPHYVSLSVTSGGTGVGISNAGFKGISVKKDSQYDFSLYARNESNFSGSIKAQVEDENGNVISNTVNLTGIGRTWKKFQEVIAPTTTDTNARFVVYTTDTGTVDMDMISLIPEDTYAGKNGKTNLRKDLVAYIADAKPKFIRFPGGCVVEGKSVKQMYEWKDLIGPIEQRKIRSNFWGSKSTPYYECAGLGYYEYFTLCEDVGAAPLPVMNCGMTFTNDYTASSKAELQPYIQDVLDLIDWANGDGTTKWSKKRVEEGHAAPFHLKYIEIGNENWTSQYFTIFKYFEKAVHRKYPYIQLIMGTGTTYADDTFKYAWANIKSQRQSYGSPVTYADEHYYNPAKWFLSNNRRYDSYSRANGVYLGEFAVSDDKTNSLSSALAEAAYMTGLERNSDVVKMASYAPLFAKADDYQWHPNAIWFNGLSSYGTPNYYVQKMFSTNVGNKQVDSKLSGYKVSSAIKGGIALGTYKTNASFSNLKVTKNTDHSTMFSDGFSALNRQQWNIFSGNWAVSNNSVGTSDNKENDQMYKTNDSWSNYTLDVDAVKTSGSEGFMIGVGEQNTSDAGYWFNVGGWSNSKNVLQKANGAVSPPIVATAHGFQAIQNNQKYHIKIVVSGLNIKCYLNGKLQIDYTDKPTHGDVYSNVTYDTEKQEAYIKIVNTSSSQKKISINMKNARNIGQTATAEILTSDSDSDVNSLDNPLKVSPTITTLNGIGGSFTYKTPKYSVNIITIKMACLKNVKTVTRFETGNQKKTVDYGTVSLNLKDSVRAFVDGHEETISGVTWSCERQYDPYTAGAYIFTARLPEGYAVEDGIPAPVITVIVRAKPSGGGSSGHSSSGKGSKGGSSFPVPQQTEQSAGFRSDTTGIYHFAGGSLCYYYKITTTDSIMPSAVSSDLSVATVEFAQKLTEGYLFKVNNVGIGTATITTTAGDGTATVFTVQGTGASGNVESDTPGRYKIQLGESYQFKFTVTAKTGTPVFTCGNSRIIKPVWIKKIGNACYLKVQAVSKGSAGIYVTIPGNHAMRKCVLTVG